MNVVFFTPNGRTTIWLEVAFLLLRLPEIGWVIGTLLIIAGCIFLAGAEGIATADASDRWRRRLIVCLSVLPTVAVIAGVLSFGQLTFLPQRSARPIGEIGFFATAACTPLPALLFFQLRGLARRAGATQLADQCRIVGIGASVALLVALAIYGFTLNPAAIGLGDHWARRGSKSLIPIVALYINGLIFYCWGVWLLVRFRQLVRRATRQLREAWRSGDRALG